MSRPSFTILLPSLEAFSAPRFHAPTPSHLTSDNHNLSFLFGLYGETLATGGSFNRDILMQVDPHLANGFPFLSTFGLKTPIALRAENLIRVTEKDGLNEYDILSLKAALLIGLQCYWRRYTYLPDGTQCRGRVRQARNIIDGLYQLNLMLHQHEPFEPLLIPVATMTTSLLDLDESDEKEVQYSLTHATYLLGATHLDDLTKLRERDERLKGEGGSLAANMNTEDLIEHGQEAAAICYGDFDLPCHRHANKPALIRFLVKHSALFEFISELTPTYYNAFSEPMTMSEACDFARHSPVSSSVAQRQLLADEEKARQAAQKTLRAISQKL